MSREKKIGVSGNCSAGRHNRCYAVNCTCPCGHGKPPEDMTKTKPTKKGAA